MARVTGVTPAVRWGAGGAASIPVTPPGGEGELFLIVTLPVDDFISEVVTVPGFTPIVENAAPIEGAIGVDFVTFRADDPVPETPTVVLSGAHGEGNALAVRLRIEPDEALLGVGARDVGVVPQGAPITLFSESEPFAVQLLMVVDVTDGGLS